MKKIGLFGILCLLLSLSLLMGGCRKTNPPPGSATYREFKDRVIGLQFYKEKAEGENPQLTINVADKQLARRFQELLGPLPRTEDPPEPWSGQKGYLAFRYMEENEIKASPFYPFWYGVGLPSYIKLEDGWHLVPGEFMEKLSPLEEYTEASSDIEPEDVAFLKQYGWTIFYKIKSYYGRLPESFIHESGEYPVSLYYAYNNELCRDIGLDISPYLGKHVTVNLYKLEEPLPAFLAPRQQASRAVVVKDGSRIVGAWLDAGRPYGFACSLKGRTLEEITGKPFGEWVEQYVNHQNPQEKLLSRMEPERVIQAYFEAIDRKDPKTAHACETRRRLTQYLFEGMDNNRLYNYSYSVNDSEEIRNILRARVIKIEPHRQENWDKDTRTYRVEVDLNVKRVINYESGRHIWYMTLRRESPNLGWRIDQIERGSV